ncbi:5'-nucleotidase, lipoprotein e(P4) family [Brevibacterium oceani]|uniref:5'-nucleotidase, lipoprotein e(P4) family n=1 Tax=Brevibacterium oceani TaxID=358099 RepID=UPI001B32AF0D|nr:HAD family acid phosphatase [Brevibacterium oceani]
MKKAFVPALTILLVLIIGVIGYILNSGPTADDEATGDSDSCDVSDYTMGVKWQQQSAEAVALQGQTYGMATRALDKAVADAPEGEGLAIMTDLDETAIDNSKLLARDIAECHDFSGWDTWDDWEKNGEPTLIPGAAEFFDHADELGVDIYYVSDRTEENRAENVATLAQLGLPQADDEHVLLLGPPKAERRAQVESDHTLLMQLGDSLHDFDGAFADASVEEQRELVEKNRAKFGSEWMILPNPTYGDWSESDLDEWKAPVRTDD